ncbi:predicted protein [Verticillium alfalfae VaMs.102]|uniref:Predicted protein n=1 Tax=Verticillium alfalfae (strain VaMs.102 / ATCC MYA-4576 / FGSC 10136) TaxID=526221 RepID=C9SYC7_VERA1|nr:predicted protein [Verticillium alfalfae VaMs.102]EEY23792.1 predicted protein [Verticillium alfalfae VaMs.102]
MRLPSEIRDEVVSYFLVPILNDRYPEKEHGTVDWNSFASLGPARAVRVWQPSTRSDVWESTRFYQLELDEGSLLGLRLVSHDWHTSATLMLAKHHLWRLRFDSTTSIGRAVNALPSLGQIPLQQPVSKLSIDDTGSVQSFRRLYEDIHYDNDPKYEDKPVWYPSLGDGGERHPAPDPLQIHYNKTKTHDRILQLKLILRRLEEQRDNWADCYDLTALNEIAVTFRYAFTKSPAFQYVTDLRLQVPSTHYIGELANALDIEARTRLKSLQVVIMDQTGSCGNRDFSSRADPHHRDDMADGVIDDDPDIEDEANFPYSNVQRIYPNRKHQKALWAFVRSCRNLEALYIQGSHFLDLDLLGWSTAANPKWQGLQVLALSRVYVSPDSLLDLIRPHPEVQGTSRLCRISLDDLKMRDGKWAPVFNYLNDKCSDLECGSTRMLVLFGHPQRTTNGLCAILQPSSSKESAGTIITQKVASIV